VPELPDIRTYVSCIEVKAGGERLNGVRLSSPFLVRTVTPSVEALTQQRLRSAGHVGKRIVLGFENDVYLVVHLMISGRLHWKEGGAPLKGKQSLAALDFENGSLVLTEAGSKKRASFHVVEGIAAVKDFDPGGLDAMSCSAADFAARLRETNHSVKRALTDPRIISGIGNAYSDEILHHARLSPLLWTTKLKEEEISRLQAAIREVMEEWTSRLHAEAQAHGGWPPKVTAFRKEMAVHGKYEEPCPVCGSSVQRIAYANNETNYCPTCQTGGVLLADRSMSRLLKKDWPRTLEELEELRRTART